MENALNLVEYSDYFIDSFFDVDIFLVYPLIVLATNRALDTVISRKPRSERFIPFDLGDMHKIGRFKALYAGLVPTIFFSILFTTSIYK